MGRHHNTTKAFQVRTHRTLRSTAQTKNTHASVVSRSSMQNIGPTADTLWTNHLTLRRRQTTKDEDGDGRRRRQTKTGVDVDGRRRRQSKTKTDSLWGRAKWQLPYSYRHPRMTKTELDTSPLVRPAESRAHEVSAVPAAPGPVVEPPPSCRS